MGIIQWDILPFGGYLKRLFFVCITLLLVFGLITFLTITASAAVNCPNCGGVGEPAGAFCDLCDSCGSCLRCGYACIDCCSIGRRCGDCCCEYCGDSCDTCDGCIQCGSGCDPECPDCSDSSVSGNRPDIGQVPFYPEVIDIKDEPLPLFDLFGTPIFFFAPFGIPSWAIVNVLLTIAGIALSLVTILRAVLQKKTENKNVDNQYSAMVRNADSFNNDVFFSLIKHKEDYNKKRRLGALISMYVFSLGALILLFIVQDFKGVIALFDRWVIIHATLFTGVVVCNRLVFRKYENIPANHTPAKSSL
jgi:hypothetical protein